MTRVFLATVLFAAALAPTVTAQQDDTPVVSTIADTNPAAAPSLQIRSDGLGSYIHKPRYLSSVIQPIGDWELDLGMIVTRGSGRRVYLNFEQPVQGSGLSGGAPIAPPSQQYVVRFITKCYSVNENMWLVPAGQQITCPMFINFDDYNGNHFRVQMSRAAAASSDEPNVTCTTIGADGRCAGGRSPQAESISTPTARR
jgi:hypothetical protein